MEKILMIIFSFIVFFSCSNQTDLSYDKDVSLSDQNKTAYFAAGCFWCVEAIFESVRGVDEVISGYSGGVIKNPTYEQVSSGRLKHAEAVKVIYDPSMVSYSTLVDVFFASHDPSTLNQQGPDKGPQYRSIAFYQTEEEKKVIEEKISILKRQKLYPRITTEVKKFEVFYKAEEYHQDYEKKHPNNGYVQAVSIPRLNAFKQKMPEVLK